MLKTMKATVTDVELTFPEGGALETRVGVIDGGFEDWMLEAALFDTAYFWFDDVSEISLGEDVGDDTIITKIFDTYEVSEECEVEDE